MLICVRRIHAVRERSSRMLLGIEICLSHKYSLSAFFGFIKSAAQFVAYAVGRAAKPPISMRQKQQYISNVSAACCQD